MTKTLKLTGAALELAIETIKVAEASNERIGELKAQAEALKEATDAQTEGLKGQLMRALDLGEDECCHIDATYLAEHGLLFVITGCPRPGIGGMLDAMLSEMNAKPKTGGGFH